MSVCLNRVGSSLNLATCVSRYLVVCKGRKFQIHLKKENCRGLERCIVHAELEERCMLSWRSAACRAGGKFKTTDTHTYISTSRRSSRSCRPNRAARHRHSPAAPPARHAAQRRGAPFGAPRPVAAPATLAAGPRSRRRRPRAAARHVCRGPPGAAQRALLHRHARTRPPCSGPRPARSRERQAPARAAPTARNRSAIYSLVTI